MFQENKGEYERRVREVVDKALTEWL
jgi:hypothetical protein